MRHLILAGVLATLATGAHAQVLASVDNGSVGPFGAPFNGLFPLDGTKTSLTFTTTKPNETVVLSFGGARCGIQQFYPQVVSTLNTSNVEGFFYLDGALVPTATGNAYTLCTYNVMPQIQGMIQYGAGQMQQRITIPGVGKHAMSVLFQVSGTLQDGTNIYPVFGESHAEIRK